MKNHIKAKVKIRNILGIFLTAICVLVFLAFIYLTDKAGNMRESIGYFLVAAIFLLLGYRSLIDVTLPPELMEKIHLNNIQKSFMADGNKYNDYSSLANMIIGRKLSTSLLMKHCGWKEGEIESLKQCIKNKSFMEQYFPKPLDYDDVIKIKEQIFNSKWLENDASLKNGNKVKGNSGFTQKFYDKYDKIMDTLDAFFCERGNGNDGSLRIYASYDIFIQLQLYKEGSPSSFSDQIGGMLISKYSDENKEFPSISRQGYYHAKKAISNVNKKKATSAKKKVEDLKTDLTKRLMDLFK